MKSHGSMCTSNQGSPAIYTYSRPYIYLIIHVYGYTKLVKEQHDVTAAELNSTRKKKHILYISLSLSLSLSLSIVTHK